jgi:hypothetical protein
MVSVPPYRWRDKTTSNRQRPLPSIFVSNHPIIRRYSFITTQINSVKQHKNLNPTNMYLTTVTILGRLKYRIPPFLVYIIPLGSKYLYFPDYLVSKYSVDPVLPLHVKLECRFRCGPNGRASMFTSGAIFIDIPKLLKLVPLYYVKNVYLYKQIFGFPCQVFNVFISNNLCGFAWVWNLVSHVCQFRFVVRIPNWLGLEMEVKLDVW